MNRFVLVTAVMLSATTSFAQQPREVIVSQTAIHARRLQASTQKTVHLLFPAAITSVDRGSADILVQKTPGVENVLKLKAAQRGFTETNLTVITTDGRYYSFAVSYMADPTQLTWQILPEQASSASQPAAKQELTAIFSETERNAANMKALIGQASITKRNVDGVSDAGYGMKLSLCGLYTAKDLFFYKLVMHNQSSISYDVEAIRFYVRDKKRVKRTATQEVSLSPLEITGNANRIEAGREEMLIVVMPKLTIAADKELVVECSEQNGGRKLTCRMNNKQLLKAKPIKATQAVSHLSTIAQNN